MTAVQDNHAGWTEALGETATNPATPRTSGQTIKALGKEWTVSSCENRIKAQFEQWVRKNAEAVWINHENPEIGRLLMGGYLEARSAGHYNWEPDAHHSQGGRAIRGALADFAGMKYLFFLLLRRCQKPDGVPITEKLAARILDETGEQAMLAIRWALGNSDAPSKGATEPVVTMDQD